MECTQGESGVLYTHVDTLPQCHEREGHAKQQHILFYATAQVAQSTLCVCNGAVLMQR